MSETQPLWKPIPAPVPLEMQHQAILGGWYKRGIWRTAVCDWYDGASGFQSERGGTATHYVCVLPIAPVPPAGAAVAASEAGVLDASPDPAVTDWDGDPTGPPVV